MRQEPRMQNSGVFWCVLTDLDDDETDSDRHTSGRSACCESSFLFWRLSAHRHQRCCDKRDMTAHMPSPTRLTPTATTPVSRSSCGGCCGCLLACLLATMDGNATPFLCLVATAVRHDALHHDCVDDMGFCLSNVVRAKQRDRSNASQSRPFRQVQTLLFSSSSSSLPQW